jgi:HYR domain
MHGRPLRRATALALVALLTVAGTAMADQLFADGDVLNTGIQGTKPLGNVAAGAEVSVEVEFTLTCVGLGHVDLGQTVLITWGGLGSAPLGGSIVSVTPASVGPVTAPWAVDSEGCPSPVPSITGTTTRSTVTLRAPTTPANGYMYTVVYDRALSPANPSDASAFSRSATQVSFTLNVVGNTAPTLTAPTSFPVEGNTTGGWTADWSGVSATDPEDDPDPTPTCDPAAGSVLPLGITTVSCSVTDSGGAGATRGFDVTVVDTTDPVLHGMPGGRSLTTGNPAGVAVTYTPPTATDIVDPSPAVDCSPASGATFRVGTTTVNCTATDASGNEANDSFTVDVAFVAPRAATAIWMEPVGEGQVVFEANHSRTIPVKVRLFVDGVERSSGLALLTLTPCGGGTTALGRTLEWGGGRWNAALDTSMLPGDCYVVAASIDGVRAGSFRLELRGEAALARLKASAAASSPPRRTGQTKPR